MNIVLFTNKDFESNLAYNLLKAELIKHQVKIYYSETVGKSKAKPKDLLEMEYYEKDFIYTELIQIIKRHQINTGFEFFTEDFSSFELSFCSNPNTPKFIEEVSLFDPDLFISIRFGKIFRDQIIKIPKKGVLNLHSAILPDYRGILGTLHTLKDDKREYGCTLHYISNRGIDVGEIIKVARHPVNKAKSLLWHIVKLYPLGCDLIIESLRRLETLDQLPVKEQDLTAGNYFSLPGDVDFDRLRARGFEHFSASDYVELLAEYVSPLLINHLSRALSSASL